MKPVLHLTSGDIAGNKLRQSGIPGEVFVWHDILYDGPRVPGWPDKQTLAARARFLCDGTDGALNPENVTKTLEDQYHVLERTEEYQRIILWFDACLFDQTMLAHVLACLHLRGAVNADLLCVDAYPGIETYHGLGQLEPAQLAGLYGRQAPVTDAQYAFAGIVDTAFADQDQDRFVELSRMRDAPLPWVPAAVKRWLAEWPDPITGLGRLEQLALNALRIGCETPVEIFSAVGRADTPPQYWGDTTLWGKLNGLADRIPPLVMIQGPAQRLPLWESEFDLDRFTISLVPEKGRQHDDA